MLINIQSDQPVDKLINELIDLEIQVGMVEFTNKEDIISIPKTYKKIGNFELDILAIDSNTREIVMLDHDQPNFVIGKVAKSISQFVDALKPIEKYFDASIEDENMYDDTKEMSKTTANSSSIAGDVNFLWFYNMIFGI